MMTRRIDAVGLDGALFERDVTRTLERVSRAGGLTIHWPIPRTRDALGHSGVQPWSAGAIFPATIATVERYEEFHTERGMAWVLPAVHVSRSFRLTLDGHSEEYATWDDAERVALAILADPRMRASWNEPEYSLDAVADMDARFGGLFADPDETMPGDVIGTLSDATGLERGEVLRKLDDYGVT